MLTLALAAYALAMTTGRGRFGSLNVALLVVAAVGAWLFLRAEARASAPLVRLTMFRDASLSASLVMSAFVSTVTGALALFLTSSTLGVPGYLAPLVILTAGYAIFQTATNTAVMTTVWSDQRGVTSGLLNLSRNLGLITGASVMGAVFALAVALGSRARARRAVLVEA